MSSEKEITIYDIASFLKISPSTVSRGLKSHPKVNERTRKKILSAAKDLGYQSNQFASSLRSKKTYTIGVIVPRLDSYFMSTVLSGMEGVAQKNGYNLIISQSLEKQDKEITNAATMFSKRVDGLLVSLSYETRDLTHFEPFFKKGIPVVFFDRGLYHGDSTNVVIDNFRASYNITKHLIDQGCKRIMHISGNPLRDVYADRLNGYKKALEDNNIVYDEALVQMSDLNKDAGIAIAKSILKMNVKPDAVFTANDMTAVHCMNTLIDAGIKIPEEIAFAGFNNDPISSIIQPKLTTINYPGAAMGEAAVMSFLNHINGVSSVKTTNTIILRSDLIIRESSLKK